MGRWQCKGSKINFRNGWCHGVCAKDINTFIRKGRDAMLSLQSKEVTSNLGGDFPLSCICTVKTVQASIIVLLYKEKECA